LQLENGLFFSFGENMPKVILGKKNGLSLHWKSEDIGDLNVKNVTNSELINQANELRKQ
jgi:hypothetical protein